jgi:NAD-dependent DNA ligase
VIAGADPAASLDRANELGVVVLNETQFKDLINGVR